MIPFVVQFISRDTAPETILYTEVANNYDDCYNKIVLYIKKKIDININYPSEFDDFNNLIWFSDSPMCNNDLFDYQIFYENKWIKPWTKQDIYNDILDLIEKLDIQNSIFISNDEFYITNDDEHFITNINDYKDENIEEKNIDKEVKEDKIVEPDIDFNKEFAKFLENINA
jgi:hypothetical protein